MAGLSATLRRLRPYILMVFLQFGFAGIHIISVATLKEGMSHYVLVVYRNIVAVVTLLPFALWFERRTRPKMSLSVFLKILAMAVMEIVLDQNLYYMGTKLTSASFASALIKIPAIPFVMAILLRIEKVNLKERSQQAKIIGNFITVAGAAVMIFYKGPVIEFIWSKGRSHLDTDASNDGTNWVTGAIILFASAICFSSFIFIQSNTLKSYPANLSLTTIICFVGTVMNTIVALLTEHGNPSAWAIGWDIRLLSAVYSGTLCTGVAYYMQGVVMKERDPVFVTAFNPLCMIIVVFLGSIILAEVITLGRMLGVAIIVIGLYLFIWGKTKDYVAKISESSAKDAALELPKTNGDHNNFASLEEAIAVEIPAIQNSKNCEGNFESKDIITVVDILETQNT